MCQGRGGLGDEVKLGISTRGHPSVAFITHILKGPGRYKHRVMRLFCNGRNQPWDGLKQERLKQALNPGAHL